MSALMRDFPSLMSSLMNLLVLSSSASCDLSVSRKCGLSRQQSLNSSAGSPIAPKAPSRGTHLPRGPGGPLPPAHTQWDPGWHPLRPSAPQVWRRLAPRAASPCTHDSQTEPGPGCWAAAPATRHGAAGEQEAQRRTYRGAGKPASWRASAAAASPPLFACSLSSSLERPLTAASATPRASGPLEPASDDLIPAGPISAPTSSRPPSASLGRPTLPRP